MIATAFVLQRRFWHRRLFCNNHENKYFIHIIFLQTASPDILCVHWWNGPDIKVQLRIYRDMQNWQRRIWSSIQGAVFFYLTWVFALVSFSDHLVSIFHLSVNFTYFYFLLQNQWVNFKQTWHKKSLGEGDSSLFNLYSWVIKRKW